MTLKRKLVAENTEIATKLHELAGDQNVNLTRKLVAENTEIATKLHELAGDQNVSLKQKLVVEDTEIATNVHELAEKQDVALKRKLDAENTQIATKLQKSAEDQGVILKRKLVVENTNIASKVQKSVAADCFARKNNVIDSNKEITELPTTEEKTTKITKKHDTDIKLVLPRTESKRFTLRNRIHIYNSKRWKECKEKAIRIKEKQKLCQGRLKKGKHTSTTREYDCENNEDNSKLGAPVRYRAGVRTKILKSSKLPKKRLSLLTEEKDNTETCASLSVAEDFVENQKSSLSLRFEANPGNSDSCHENLNLCAEKDQKSMKFNFFI